MDNNISLQYIEHINFNQLNIFLKKLNEIKKHNEEILMEDNFNLEEEKILMELSILTFKDFSLIKKKIKDQKILALLDMMKNTSAKDEYSNNYENDFSLNMENILLILIDSLINCSICYLSYEIEQNYDREILKKSLNDSYTSSHVLREQISEHLNKDNIQLEKNNTPEKYEYNLQMSE
jgi:hypothetical protein